jgi:membrane protein
MLPVMGLLLLVATAVPLALSLVAHFGFLGSWSGLPQIETYGFSLVLVFVVAALLYRYLPNRALRWPHVVRGAAFTAVAFNVAQIAFAVYTTHVNFTHVYGAVAALAVALLWFYYVGTIFLFGAEVAVADEAERA